MFALKLVPHPSSRRALACMAKTLSFHRVNINHLPLQIDRSALGGLSELDSSKDDEGIINPTARLKGPIAKNPFFRCLVLQNFISFIVMIIIDDSSVVLYDPSILY
jgi:hypothetical protein